MADQGQRTEQPTRRRIEKARREGHFPVSREFVSSLHFAASAAVLVAASATCVQALGKLVTQFLTFAGSIPLSFQSVIWIARQVLLPAALPLVFLGGLLSVFALLVQLASTRAGFSFKRLLPDFKRLDPVQKLKQLPAHNIPQLFQALVLLPLFLLAVYGVAKENWDLIVRLPLMNANAGVVQLGHSVKQLLWRGVVLFVVWGLVDLYRQNRRYIKQLRMTKQEVREELKEVEGNPYTRARIRRMQRELLRRRMMAAVPKATAVVVNPTHYAVALQYEMEIMAAPRVVAKGKNWLALRIRQLAIEHGVPVVEHPPLAQALYHSVEIGQEIPVHLYRAVAEILAYIYRLQRYSQSSRTPVRKLAR